MQISSDELHECGLPSSTRTYECGPLSSLDREWEIREYFSVVIAVGDIMDGDIFVLWSEYGSSGVSFNFWCIIKYLP